MKARWAWAGFAVLAVALLISGWVMVRLDSEVVACPADGMIAPEGSPYGRSMEPGMGCQFVDDDGDLVTHGINGQPICYGPNNEDGFGEVVACDTPGSRRPG